MIPRLSTCLPIRYDYFLNCAKINENNDHFGIVRRSRRRCGSTRGRGDRPPARVAADRTVLGAAPAILGGTDDAAKQDWVLCVWDPPMAPEVLSIRHALALQHGNGASQARTALLASAAALVR